MKLLLANFAFTCYMVGLIWFVQVVHYPLFGKIGASTFTDCQAFHLSRVTWVVGPPMLLEGITAAGLLWLYPHDGLFQLGALLLGMIWMSTALVQVPKHNVLAVGFDPSAHRHLVTWNWVRTALWTLRGCLVMSALWTRVGTGL